MKIIIATMLVVVTLGEAYSQDRNRRDRGDRGSRTERSSRNSGSSRTTRAPRTSRTERRSEPRTSRRTETRRTETRRVEPRRPVERRSDRVRDRRVERRNDRVTRTSPGRGRVDTSRRGTVNRGPVTRRPVTRVDRRNARRVRRYHSRPSRTAYGTRNYHRPYRYVYRPYRSYRHSSVARRYTSHRRYASRYDYYNYLRRSYRSHIYLNWVLFPSTRVNGYYYVDNYPYYIYNGYRHRYSYEDLCNYQLVDSYTHQVVRSNYPSTCARGYDACAWDRDGYNSSVRENRYFCAESIRGDNYNYSTPTYDYDEYEYDYDYGYNSSYGVDNYNTGRTTCYSYDPQSGICYDN